MVEKNKIIVRKYYFYVFTRHCGKKLKLSSIFQLQVQTFSSCMLCQYRFNLFDRKYCKLCWCQHFLKCNFRCHGKYYHSFSYICFSSTQVQNLQIFHFNTSKLKVWQSWPPQILQNFTELKFYLRNINYSHSLK